MTPKFSIVTTWKGRLRDLQQSLPTFVSQAAAEVVVVDYDCPEGTGRNSAEAVGSRLRLL
jgi:hypothetical protein